MNGIVILICALLLIMAMKLLMERGLIRLFLFCLALLLICGVKPG